MECMPNSPFSPTATVESGFLCQNIWGLVVISIATSTSYTYVTIVMARWEGVGLDGPVHIYA